MKPLLTISILFLTSCSATQQTFTPAASRPSLTGQDYTANWSTGDQSAVTRYFIQASKDTANWSTIAYIPKTANGTYAYTITSPINGFYRIGATGVMEFYTPAIFLNLNTATITNTSVTSTYLYWTASNVSNVSTYLIEKTSDFGRNWSQTTPYKDRGNGKYTYKLAKTVKRYQYRLTVIFKDGSKGVTVNF